MPEIKEQMEEVAKLVAGIQSDHEAKSKLYGEQIAGNDVAIKNMEEKFAEVSQSIQDATAKAEAEKKATDETIKELTLAVARGANSEKREIPEMSDEIKGALHAALTEHAGVYAIDRKVSREIITEHVKYSFGHLTNEKQDALVKSIMASGSESAGGLFCPVSMDSRIRKRMWETTPMRQISEVITTIEKAREFVLDDEDIITQQRGEVDTVTATGTPEFGQVRIDVHEQAAYPKATLTVLEDSTLDLTAFLTDKVSSKFARQDNENYVTGTGLNKPTGILSYSDAAVNVYERFKIGTLTTAAAITIAGDDLIDLQSNLLEGYQANANWLMHRLIWAKVVKLKDEDGQYLLNPAVLFQGAKPQLLGAPVVMAGDMPRPSSGVLVAGTKYVTYGDFRQGYTIIDRLGISVIRDNITTKGYMKWYFRKRGGGGVTNFQALKHLKAKAS